MSETTPSPEPASGPTDPTAAPAAGEPAAWTPPDPLAAPQPWNPPTPWSPSDPSPWAPSGDGPTDRSTTPGSADAAGSAGWATAPGQPDAADQPGAPDRPPAAYPTGPYPPASHPTGPYSSGPYSSGPYPSGPYPAGPYPPGPYPPPYAYPGATPRRSGGRWVVGLVIAVVAALVLAVCGCVGLGALGGFVDGATSSGEPYDEPYIYGPDEPDLAPTTQAPATPVTTPSGGPGRFTVVYEVTGTDDVSVQFYDADGTFHALDAVAAPWRLRFTANDRQKVQLVVGTTEADGGASCRITIDGKVVSRKSGKWGVACFGW